MFALLSIGLAPPPLQASCSRGAVARPAPSFCGAPSFTAVPSFTAAPPLVRRARLTAMQLAPRDGGGGKEESFFDKLNPFKKKEESALTKGMDELLKDAPLPVKMFGALAKPLVESNSPRSRMSPELLLEVRLVRLARLRHPVDHLVEESGWVSDP